MKSTELPARIKFLLAMAGLGGLLYGVDFGVIATAEPYLKALGIYSDGQIGLIVGAVLLGGILSSLSAGVLCEWFGRKKMIVASAAMFLAAIPIVCLTLNDFGPLFAGRVLQGMSAGYMSVVMPMYLTETLPSDIRGRGTGIFQFFLGLGLVVAAAAGYLVAGIYGSADAAGLPLAAKVGAWRANFWWTMLPVAVLFAGSLFLKESPVWKNPSKISKLQAPSSDLKAPSSKLKANSLLQRRYVVPFLLAVLVLTFNKTTGTSTFTSYLVTIFHKSGFDGLLGNAGQFTIKIVNLLVTVFAATLVDRKGRVWLLKIGTMGMTIGLLSVGAVFTGIERFGLEPSRMTGLVTLAGFFVMQVFYALGPGICVWLVLSELMPQRIRANGMAIALFMNQLVAWGLASTFRSWIAAWGWDTMFYFFAVNGLLYFITVLFIPETNGKSLDELEHLFDGK
ncbi:MAG: MFS transporter [bacterium]|nr:MFS transporter [bacterium]